MFHSWDLLSKESTAVFVAFSGGLDGLTYPKVVQSPGSEKAIQKDMIQEANEHIQQDQETDLALGQKKTPTGTAVFVFFLSPIGFFGTLFWTQSHLDMHFMEEDKTMPHRNEHLPI